MSQTIIVVDSRIEDCLNLCAILEHQRYEVVPAHSLAELLGTLEGYSCSTIILDFDSLPVDNSFIRDLIKTHPSLCIIGKSNRTFHPELEEALRNHIFACFSKPLNLDELFYWLRSFSGDELSGRASPGESKTE